MTEIKQNYINETKDICKEVNKRILEKYETLREFEFGKISKYSDNYDYANNLFTVEKTIMDREKFYYVIRTNDYRSYAKPEIKEIYDFSRQINFKAEVSYDNANMKKINARWYDSASNFGLKINKLGAMYQQSVMIAHSAYFKTIRIESFIDFISSYFNESVKKFIIERYCEIPEKMLNAYNGYNSYFNEKIRQNELKDIENKKKLEEELKEKNKAYENWLNGLKDKVGTYSNVDDMVILYQNKPNDFYNRISVLSDKDAEPIMKEVVKLPKTQKTKDIDNKLSLRFGELIAEVTRKMIPEE